MRERDREGGREGARGPDTEGEGRKDGRERDRRGGGGRGRKIWGEREGG